MIKQPIQFSSDRIVVRGPLADGGYAITFYTGEYDQKKVAEILKIPQQKLVAVSVELKKGEE